MEEKSSQLDLSLYLSKYLTPVLERKWVVLICIVLGFLAAAALSFLVPPQYRSRASVLVEQPRTMISMGKGEDSVAPPGAREGYIHSEAEKLRSSLFAAEVLKTLPAQARNDLRASADLVPQLKSRIKRLLGLSSEADPPAFQGKNLLSEMTRRMEVQVKPRAAIIEVSALTLDKDVAPILVNRYLDVWKAENIRENKKEVNAQRAFVFEERNKAFQQYKEAEQALVAFRRKHELPADIEALRDGILQLELNGLKNDLSEAQSRLELMEKRYLDSRVKEAGVVGNIKVLDTPSTVTPIVKPLIQRMFFLGTLFGVLLGVGLALLPEFFRSPIRHESDIMASVGYPVLGHIPKL